MFNADLHGSALIVIDMQRYFLERGASAYINPPFDLIPNVLKLCRIFREARLPIVFTRHAHRRGEPAGRMGAWWKNRLPWVDDADSALIADIAPLPGEALLIKTTYSAFEGTELEDILEKNSVSTIVLCGVTTNLCVETTARHAFIKGFQPVVVGDACAAKSEEFHRASVVNLSYGFAFIETTDEIAKTLSAVCANEETK